MRTNVPVIYYTPIDGFVNGQGEEKRWKQMEARPKGVTKNFEEFFSENGSYGSFVRL